MALLDIVNFEKRREKRIARLRIQHPDKVAEIERVASHNSDMESVDIDNLILGMYPPSMLASISKVAVLIGGCAVAFESLYRMVDVQYQSSSKEALLAVGGIAGLSALGAGYVVFRDIFGMISRSRDYSARSRRVGKG